tara:strand:- start:2350 stop:2643 length:294 start_codon:yes stop_codon:yes gene_type:complete
MQKLNLHGILEANTTKSVTVGKADKSIGMEVRGLKVNIKELEEYYHAKFTFNSTPPKTDESITNFKNRIDNVIHYLEEEGFFDAEKLIKIGISHKIQ